MGEVDIVLIGRNEGKRLLAALSSVQGVGRRVVYVDSGSTDGSLAHAEAAGVETLALSSDTPFSAARARDTGFRHLEETGGVATFVQFMDGDCALAPDWISTAAHVLSAQPDLGLVTGWRSEIAADASLYNAMCHLEWRRPAGDIQTCGGDMMVRSKAYRAVGGFHAEVIAAEDDEFCCRLRKAGWRLHRIPMEMTRHDAAMTRFGQWWQRAVRTGHGFEQVGAMHPESFRRERLRMWTYGLILPVLLLVGLLGQTFWLIGLIALIYGPSYFRTARGLVRREGVRATEAWRHAGLLTLSKLPNAMGGLRYRLRQITGRATAIIEYK